MSFFAAVPVASAISPRARCGVRVPLRLPLVLAATAGELLRQERVQKVQTQVLVLLPLLVLLRCVADEGEVKW
jgi:hypothetical protein